MKKTNKVKKILWAVCLVGLVTGIMLLSISVQSIEYSTNEYWVATDYHHVYEKSTGEIVDYISDNENCSIKGDTIIVKTKNKVMRGWGIGITITFGAFAALLIWIEIDDCSLTQKNEKKTIE